MWAFFLVKRSQITTFLFKNGVNHPKKALIGDNTNDKRSDRRRTIIGLFLGILRFRAFGSLIRKADGQLNKQTDCNRLIAVTQDTKFMVMTPSHLILV